MEVTVIAVLCPLLDLDKVSGLRIKVFLDSAEKLPGEVLGTMVSRTMKIRMMAALAE